MPSKSMTSVAGGLGAASGFASPQAPDSELRLVYQQAKTPVMQQVSDSRPSSQPFITLRRERMLHVFAQSHRVDLRRAIRRKVKLDTRKLREKFVIA